MWTPGKRLALASLAAAAFGCGSGGGASTDARADSFDRRALLRNLGENVIVPNYQALDGAAAAMVTAVDAYCAAIESGDTTGEAEALAAARDAWRQAMVYTQRAELTVIGPAAADDRTLRDELYSWPVSSTCGVDIEVVAYFDDPASFDISGKLTNRRGMDALEYVLFSESLEHTCTPQVAPPGWDDLADLERRRARCGFASAAAADVAVTAGALVAGWSPSGGGFLDDLAGAGDSGSSFDSAQVALNTVSDAMFYIEFEVKDIKVGESAGITDNSCNVVGEACLEELESLFAAHTKENVLENMRAFQALFTGGDGVGFDDMLAELGAPELAATMTADIAQMIASAEAVDGSFRDALVASYADVAAVHASIKTVTDNLKSQFLTVLGLDIPDNAAGDND